MTRLLTISLVCPICEEDFESKEVISTNMFGGKHTDFHEQAVGIQPLPFMVHSCIHCGYSGLENNFCDEMDIALALKERVLSELHPPTTGYLLGSEKYEAAAKVAIWKNEEHKIIAGYWLRAAWCCVNENDAEAERYFRIKAVKSFGKALYAFDGATINERPVFTYLIGELCRRIGYEKRAGEWFSSVEGEVIDLQDQWVIKLARQQRDCPREWFG